MRPTLSAPVLRVVSCQISPELWLCRSFRYPPEILPSISRSHHSRRYFPLYLMDGSFRYGDILHDCSAFITHAFLSPACIPRSVLNRCVNHCSNATISNACTTSLTCSCHVNSDCEPESSLCPYTNVDADLIGVRVHCDSPRRSR